MDITETTPGAPEPDPTAVRESVGVFGASRGVEEAGKVLSSPVRMGVIREVLCVGEGKGPAGWAHECDATSSDVSKNIYGGLVVRYRGRGPGVPDDVLEAGGLVDSISAVIFVLPWSLTPGWQLADAPTPAPTPDTARVGAFMDTTRTPATTDTRRPAG